MRPTSKRSSAAAWIAARSSASMSAAWWTATRRFTRGWSAADRRGPRPVRGAADRRPGEGHGRSGGSRPAANVPAPGGHSRIRRDGGRMGPCHSPASATRRDFTAREVTGDEKAAWWDRAVEAWPDYASYQKRTDRRIPVFVLEPME